MDPRLSKQPPQPGQPQPQQPQQQQQQQYTTVGSVWHPQSMPMQPPTRRGRSLRSAMPESYADNSLSPFSGTHSSYSHSHYYSPLQQNFDRAVSPISSNRPPPYDPFLQPNHTHHPGKFFPPGSPSSEPFAESDGNHFLTHPLDMSTQVAPAVPYTPTNAFGTPRKLGEAINRRDDQGDGHDRKDIDEANEANQALALGRMPTKTLTNLASYPNPMQKAAQKILTRARQAPSTMHHQLSDSTAQDGSGLPTPPRFSPRNARSDPVGVDGLLPPARADGHNINQPFTPAKINSTASATRERDSYPAVLSKGPGAPQPLTAGPPGQRHFQPSTLNTTPSTFQKDLGKTRELDHHNDGTPRLQPSSLFQPPHLKQPLSQQPTPWYKSEPTYPIHPPVPRTGKDTGSNIRVIDTLTPEEALKFYPNGFPSDFNHDTKKIPDDWVNQRLREVEEERKKKNKLLWEHATAFQEAHRAKLQQDFYAGNDRINKPIRDVISPKEKRDTAGSEPEKPEKPKDRVKNSHISLEEAEKMPTHEHAAPLISLMYQSMVNHPAFIPPVHLSKSNGPQ